MYSLRLIALTVLATVLALAADWNGTWKGQMPGRGGAAREVTFTFKVEGDKVGITMADERGSNAIKDAKLAGNTVTFSHDSGRGARTFTGVLAGDEIKFKREGGQGPQEFVAKRAQ